VRLDPELKRALLIRAAEEHVSVSEVIRREALVRAGFRFIAGSAPDIEVVGEAGRAASRRA
jgi:plasmid stability protein